jgi:DMSO/TMAO reductase YedYZ molybdopterin-dependent catalytic subunit
VKFFEKNRAALKDRGIDPDRLPPGQYFTERFPVLHAGRVPEYPSLDGWTLTIDGLVASPRTISWAELAALPQTTIEVDIHCVTKWSKFDMGWQGVPFEDLLALAGGPQPGARFLITHGEFGYTANIPLEECLGVDAKGQPKAMVALGYDGHALEPEHGYPARFLLPRLYFWKSAKWLRGLELTATDRPGFWERNGYHNHGDPFLEQRYS